MVPATISGAFVSLSIVKIFAGGAIAAISPGSLISVIAMSGSGMRILVNVIAVFAGALASFGVASVIMMFKRKANVAVTGVQVTEEGLSFSEAPVLNQTLDFKTAKKLMVACDAGVGSSAMAAGIIKKWCQQNNIDIEVKNCAVKDLDPSIDIVVTMTNFAEFAQEKSPHAYIYPVKQFLGKNIFDDLYAKLLVKVKTE
ncbi:PTS system, mannitol-specific IIBC component [Spiroplasma clarkii]|nr:hypothetical protein [Spiroplasma clarkii]ARU92137.1 PTS system, mannitol-specific IIBC component [Spiroplasma clarkii]